jgi:hypothetical protein
MVRIVGMPGPTAASAVPVGRARTLAQVYRHFGEVDAAETSPLYERVAVALSESDEALRAIEAAPARKRHPTVILAALHDLALAGRAPALAAAYAAADGDAAAGAAIDTLLRMTDSVVAIAVRRQTRTNETGRCAVLYPAIAEAARRVGANAVGLIDVGCSAGLNLNVDRVGITYSNGQSLGDPSSPVQLSSSIVGDRPIPTRAMPEVVARVGVDLDPVDVTDADDARWLRACLWPDQPERVARLEAEMALAATAPPLLLQGDAVEVVPDAFARVPADALPVVTTTWALSHFPLESRLRFLHRLDEAAAGRAVAWVSAEGVGVAPTIPTLGDRRASGHSIIGLAVFDRSALRAEAIGRCWSQGRLLAWLADSYLSCQCHESRSWQSLILLGSGFSIFGGAPHRVRVSVGRRPEVGLARCAASDQGRRSARTQNSFPSGSASTTQLSSPWPTSACRAPRSSRRRTSSSCSLSVGLTSRWSLFLTVLPSGTCANVNVGGTGPRWFLPSGTIGEPIVTIPSSSSCTS